MEPGPRGKLRPGCAEVRFDTACQSQSEHWTFIPAVAYTKAIPAEGLEIYATMGLQFYNRNNATYYQNAPLFALDLIGLKRFDNGAGVGLIVGDVQQFGKDSGPIADS